MHINYIIVSYNQLIKRVPVKQACKYIIVYIYKRKSILPLNPLSFTSETYQALHNGASIIIQQHTHVVGSHVFHEFIHQGT